MTKRKKLVSVSVSDTAPTQEAFLIPFALEDKIKTPTVFLDSYFTTEETLRNKGRQQDLFFEAPDGKDLNHYIINFERMELSLWEDRAMDGIFALMDKQGASEKNPTIRFTKAEFLNEILEKKNLKKTKDGKEFLDFSGGESNKVWSAFESLMEKPRRIYARKKIIDKGKEKTVFQILRAPLIQASLTELEIESKYEGTVTEADVMNKGKYTIQILPVILNGFPKAFREATDRM